MTIRDEAETEIRVLSKSTPITVSLMLALCAGAFWVGRLSFTVDRNSADIKINQALIKQTAEILSEIKESNKYTEKRLEKLEEGR